jgi:sulfhydrogenase subunit beta (sulfur reductase)
MNYFVLNKKDWDVVLGNLLLSHNVLASVNNGSGQDYELIRPADIPSITYNIPKPSTPIKTFFLPVSENVTLEFNTEKPFIIIGTPNCDIEGLCLLDEIYLDDDFKDPLYCRRREGSLIISSDCFLPAEHCHCTTYNIDPFSSHTADLAVVVLNESIYFRIISRKGEEFIRKNTGAEEANDPAANVLIETKHNEIKSILKKRNSSLPDHISTARLIESSQKDIWNKYALKCVSCGACNAICPTCSCFLLIDRPGFEKVRHLDACQYPGFERVAGGEDPLLEIQNRFRNRYMCKYLWKSKKFRSVACTGCGRCIEACIGRINKNELIIELQNS